MHLLHSLLNLHHLSIKVEDALLLLLCASDGISSNCALCEVLADKLDHLSLACVFFVDEVSIIVRYLELEAPQMEAVTRSLLALD